MDASGDRTAVEVNEGHTVTLECPVSSPVEGIDIEWFKNGRPFMPDDSNMQIALDKTRLVLVNIQKDGEATYTCVAKNSAGQATQEFDVIVLVPPNITGRAVEELVIVEGESLELECDFEADPIPEIQWTKDASSIGYNVQVTLAEDILLLFIGQYTLQFISRLIGKCIFSQNS
ncbi:unnamed protein product [Gongylonema pulchrum]|uniref:Ig-like domain-containing protein n=1 Tax=Gongylonema pulchrum TaxID=637853 RepID=A0A183CWH3_9BILA|nr:unnamed protein product [Gongylonema pulchrum]